MQFQIVHGKPQRSVIKLGGYRMAAITTITTVIPGSVSKQDLLDFVSENKRFFDDADPYYDGEPRWYVDIPGIGRVEYANQEHLAEEVATILNQNGVSVQDWKPFDLDNAA